MAGQDITGAILCGGKSTRMGREKSSRILLGKPIFEHVLETMKLVFDKVVVSSDRVDVFSKYNISVICDIVKNKDALGGIYSVLKKTDTERVFFIACDMPFAEVQAIKLLLNHAEDFDIVIPRIKGKFQPLFAVYSKNLLPLIEKNIFEGKLKIFDVIEKSKVKILTEKDLKKCCNVNKNFFNINTEEDFYRALNGKFKDAAIVAFVAKHSCSGKTTLVTGVIKHLKKEGYKVGVIKHTFHPVEIDSSGKDSYRFYHSGADAVVLNSSEQLVVRKRTESTVPLKYIKDNYLKELDIVLVEGHKTGNIPKIELIRDGQKEFLYREDSNVVAVVSNYPVNSSLPLFKHNEAEKISEFIKESFL